MGKFNLNLSRKQQDIPDCRDKQNGRIYRTAGIKLTTAINRTISGTALRANSI
jgi:hypothetical protein